MEYFLQTVLPKRLNLVAKVRIDEPVCNGETLQRALFTPGQIRELLNQLAGLKELRFKHEISDPEELSRLCETHFEKDGVVVIPSYTAPIDFLAYPLQIVDL